MAASVISIDENNKCGFLDIIVGPMYSGKTNKLMSELNVYSTMGASVLYINSSLDNRSDNDFSTHNPMLTTLGCVDGCKTETLYEMYSKCKNYLIIGIDEAQFFPDLKDFVLDLVEKEGKRVIVAGLSGNFKRESFGQIFDLVSYCDRFTKLSSFCQECASLKKIKEAHFSYRLMDKEKNKENIHIGSKKEYIPLCRECYLNYEYNYNSK